MGIWSGKVFAKFILPKNLISIAGFLLVKVFFGKSVLKEKVMIITISGLPGSGKSTVAKILSEKLGFKRYYAGGMRREAAKKAGMTIEEFNKLGEKDFSTDKFVDDFLVKIGKEEDNIVVEGRTAFHFIPNSIKIFLDVDLKEGARRIFEEKKQKNDRNEKQTASVEEELENLKERMESDEKRYIKYYGFTCYNKKNYDLVIDTTKITAQQAAERVLEFLKKK